MNGHWAVPVIASILILGTFSIAFAQTSPTIEATIPTGPPGFNPLGIAVNESIDRAYVANFQGFATAVIDTNTNSLITSIPGPGDWGEIRTPEHLVRS